MKSKAAAAVAAAAAAAATAQSHCAHFNQAPAAAAFACPSCQSRRYCSAACLEAGVGSRRHRTKECAGLA